MSNENVQDGSGNSIVFVDFPTVTVLNTADIPSATDGDLRSARGLVSKTTGTIKVKLTGQDTPQQVLVFEGKDCLYSIESIYAGGVGDVAITDIMLFW
jgi:hypothetical protein